MHWAIYRGASWIQGHGCAVIQAMEPHSQRRPPCCVQRASRPSVAPAQNPLFPSISPGEGKKKACLFSLSPTTQKRPRQTFSLTISPQKDDLFLPTTTDDSHHRPSICHRSNGSAPAARLTRLSRRDDHGLCLAPPQQQRNRDEAHERPEAIPILDKTPATSPFQKRQPTAI